MSFASSPLYVSVLDVLKKLNKSSAHAAFVFKHLLAHASAKTNK